MNSTHAPYKSARQLVRKQHVLPRRSIERFADNRGCVECRRVQESRSFPARPNNSIFRVERVWSQHAEVLLGTKLEGKFQEFANRLLASGSNEVLEQNVVDEFYALIRARHWAISLPAKDEVINGVSGEDLSDEQRYALEANAVMHIRADGTISARDITGLRMQLVLDRVIDALRALRHPWRLVRSAAGEFVVPDNYGACAIVPLAPTAIIARVPPRGPMFQHELAIFNMLAVRRASSYYFAHNLGNCFL